MRDSVFAPIQAVTRSHGKAPGARLSVERMRTLADVSRAACYRAWARSDPLSDETALRDVIERLALANRHDGCRGIGALPRREGWCVDITGKLSANSRTLASAQDASSWITPTTRPTCRPTSPAAAHLGAAR